jgi:hypothetical protein
MKVLFGGCSIVGICYGIYLVTQMSLIGEMMSSKNECETAALDILKSPDPLKASKALDKSCARLVRNGDIAEKVLNKLP